MDASVDAAHKNTVVPSVFPPLQQYKFKSPGLCHYLMQQYYVL